MLFMLVFTAIVLRAAPPPPKPILLPISTAAGCMIQSDFGEGQHKNFETVVLQGSDLVHYWHDNASVDFTWVRGQIITHKATGPGCIIQSDFRSGSHGNFEVVVPEGRNLVHYFHDNSNVLSAWQRAQVISTQASAAANIIQTDFKSGSHGNFELVVLEGNSLVHYFHDNSNVSLPWRRAQTITTRATSAGYLIQSDFQSNGHGNFEVVVREGNSLVHYFHDNSNVSLPWTRAQIISTTPGGPAILIQGDFESGNHGNFELLTVENGSIVHYFHDNSNVANHWQRGQTVVTPGTSVGGFLQSDFKRSSHGNFEVALYTQGRVTHYFHDNSDVNLPWRSGQIIAPMALSQKVCQLTGDTDFQNRNQTRNFTETRFAVAGTDLGYPFEHDGRLYFLFGDTRPRNRATDDGRDSVAFTREMDDPDSCPGLEFVSDGNTFRPISANGVSLAFFEVPTTGFDALGVMYVFVWTDHKDLGNGQFSNPIGHAALLRSDDQGRTYRMIWDHLGDKLVYLSAAVVNNADIPGLPQNTGQGVLLFGSGKYRASDPYLAYMPLNQVENKAAVRFYSGLNARGQPLWQDEAHAQPLFNQACVGELSSTWNRNLRQWLMLYNCDAAGGIAARVAERPWGPWSDATTIFNAERDAGRCYFMYGGPRCGPANDPATPNGQPGGPYGPYVIPRFNRGGLHSTTIYYVMSTWDPYQAQLMRSSIEVQSPLAYGPDTCRSGYVWREAILDDHVCVTPANYQAAHLQNRQASQHRNPSGGPYGLDTCLGGYVWRDAFPADHVCVTPVERQQAAADNTAGPSRRQSP